ALTGLGLYLLIVGSRSIYGIIGSATPAAAQGYIADRTPPERRTAGVASFSAAFGLGAIAGPGLGGAVAAIDPVAPLYAVAALAGAMTLIIFFFLPEKTAPAPRERRASLSHFDRRLRPFLIFGLVFGMVNAAPIQTTAFYFMDILHLSPDRAPQFAGAGLMGAAMASLFSQVVLVQRLRLEPHLLMRIAPALLAGGHALIAASHQFAPLILGLIIAGLGAGMALPGFTGAAMLAVGDGEQGSAAGLANSASSSGFIFSPLVAFTLYRIAPQAPYVLTAMLSVVLLIFALSSGKIRSAGRRKIAALSP
ncbi:MAG TPA: MFS transporter, partial [Parvularculaceae bacterium]|nr:MFS transporter [Parvularculaceae bacterium]